MKIPQNFRDGAIAIDFDFDFDFDSDSDSDGDGDLGRICLKKMAGDGCCQQPQPEVVLPRILASQLLMI